MVLGFWLISGANPAWSWVAAFGTFVGFAGISGYFGWVGVANCGCFGVVRASPWAVFGVDVAALLLLARHATGPWRRISEFPSGILEFTTATGASSSPWRASAGCSTVHRSWHLPGFVAMY